MKVLIPAMDQNEELYEWKPNKPSDGMHEKYNKGNMQGINYIFNKPPKWND